MLFLEHGQRKMLKDLKQNEIKEKLLGASRYQWH